MKNGFYIRIYNRDCFIITDAKNRTDSLAMNFLNKIQHKLNKFYNIDNEKINFVKHEMQAAALEEKEIKAGNFAGLKYLCISNDWFTLCSEATENPYDEIVVVE